MEPGAQTQAESATYGGGGAEHAEGPVDAESAYAAFREAVGAGEARSGMDIAYPERIRAVRQPLVRTVCDSDD